MSGDSSFGRITDAIEAFGWHPRVQVEQIPAPQRIAPHAYAVEASVLTTADDEVVDARGCWLMPGLIDAHLHLGLVEIEVINLAAIPGFEEKYIRNMNFEQA